RRTLAHYQTAPAPASPSVARHGSERARAAPASPLREIRRKPTGQTHLCTRQSNTWSCRLADNAVRPNPLGGADWNRVRVERDSYSEANDAPAGGADSSGSHVARCVRWSAG